MTALFGAGAALLSTAANASPVTIDDCNAHQSVTDTTANRAAASSVRADTIESNLFRPVTNVNQAGQFGTEPLLVSAGNYGFGSCVLSKDAGQFVAAYEL